MRRLSERARAAASARATAGEGVRPSRAPRTACSSMPASPSRTRPRSCRTSPRSASATSTARPTSGRAPAARTATTWSTTTRSIPRSATATTSSGSSPRCARTAWVTSSTSCRITSASWAPTTPGGWTCSRTARRRYTRISSISTGTPSNPARADKVLVPVLADPYGAVLERGELELRFERDSGSFAVFYHEHRLPLDPRTYPRILDRVAGAGLEQ